MIEHTCNHVCTHTCTCAHTHAHTRTQTESKQDSVELLGIKAFLCPIPRVPKGRLTQLLVGEKRDEETMEEPYETTCSLGAGSWFPLQGYTLLYL